MDPREVASAADIFGSKTRPDTIEIQVDHVFELAVFAKTLVYLLSDSPVRGTVPAKAVEALAQMDGFRHFKAMLPTALGALLTGANAQRTIAVEAEDTCSIVEAALVESGYFRRPSKGVFLERTDLPGEK
ncbi:hypothetical protein [Actinoplanes sp. NPDC051851]|uniref:hypothetical protein n=1 Tax=Actinoplanes sp. NPDC051851 TaxID=3154753 RepID=UPI003441C43D